MIIPGERDYERFEPSIRGIGDQEGERGTAHDGAGRREDSPKTIIDIYLTRSRKRVALFAIRLWPLIKIEKRKQEDQPKSVGRPKYIIGPNHPWRRYVPQ